MMRHRFLLIASAFAIASCGGGNNTGRHAVMSAADLYAQFAADPQRAEARYRGQRVVVSGEINKTGANYKTEELTLYYRASLDGGCVVGVVSLARIRDTKISVASGGVLQGEVDRFDADAKLLHFRNCELVRPPE